MTRRYKAFISYAHSDERWAGWLQHALETYRVPRTLRQGGGPDSSGRLFPVFRDRSELASSSDLTLSIRSALDNSEALIVVCSPEAARSRWVNQEIRYFQESGRGDRIYCLIVSGCPEREQADCAFPGALLEGPAKIPLSDPLAADVRDGADGKRGALLKIAAGLLNVGIDDLRQRDAQRRLRSRSILATGSMVISAIMLAFAVTAHFARKESEMRREQAEELIGFMLGNLREQLEPIGKLDILDAVGDQAMNYFHALGDLGTEQEILSRVLALRQIGEVRFRQGRLSQAQQAFEESRDLAKNLSGAAPNNQDYLFELGQAEFWVGYVALERADIARAYEASRNYLDYSQQLSEANPENTVYQTELFYSYSNLGTLAMGEGQAEEALSYFQRSLEINQQLLKNEPEDHDLRLDLGNGHSWMGAGYLQVGRLQHSEAAYQRAVDVLEALHRETDSPLYAENLAQNRYHLGNVHASQGDIESAMGQFALAAGLLHYLVQHDPQNAIWRGDRATNSYHRGELEVISGNAGAAEILFTDAKTDLVRLLEVDPDDLRSREYLALVERSLALLAGDFEQLKRAYQRISGLNAKMDKPSPRCVLHTAIVAESYGAGVLDKGDSQGASRIWQSALDKLQSYPAVNPTHHALQAKLMLRLGRQDSAEPLLELLEGIGYRDPRYFSLAMRDEDTAGAARAAGL